MKKKRLIGVFAIVLSLALVLVACSQSAGKTSSITSSTVSGVAPVATAGTITFEGGAAVGPTLNAWNQIVTNFQSTYPTIKVSFTNVATANYNTIMNVKMAANDMPDVYGTAGWAVQLYDKFNVDLSNEPWAAQILPNAKTAVTSSTGKLEALPMDQNLDELIYNTDLLAKYGIDDKTAFKTWDTFLAAAKTIKTKSNGSVGAFFIGGGDAWPMVIPFNYMAGIAFTEGDANAKNRAALLDGTFDWTQWAPYATKINQIFQYCNSDYTTAKAVDAIKALANQTVVFDERWMDVPAAKTLNPNLNVSFSPLPAWTASQKPAFLGGEGSAIGIWNQGKMIDDARLFLDYCARPMNIEILSEAEGSPPAIAGVTVAGFDTARLATFSADPTIPIFDRGYLPNGLWGVMMTNAGAFSSGQITADGYATIMKQNYDRLRAAASSS
jgi:raffinose/stachyose/melibiose transport system substrate-binding protein